MNEKTLTFGKRFELPEFKEMIGATGKLRILRNEENDKRSFSLDGTRGAVATRIDFAEPMVISEVMSEKDTTPWWLLHNVGAELTLEMEIDI